MNRKTLVICLVFVLALLAANAVAVFFLYRPSVPSDGTEMTVPKDTLSEVVAAADTVAVVVEVEVDDEEDQKDSVQVSLLVPEGPFKVKNSATGMMNSLVQNADNSLTLSDQNGVAQWTVPFPGPICGRVQAVDFFANGKLQYLLCTGDQLYLIDRLGRTVEGFPVKLDKPVLLGPDVYDFRGVRKYNIIVLNSDNSIDMYNLKGEKPSSWESICLSDPILGTPDFFEMGSKSYWTVRTATRNHVHSFYGREVKVFDGEVNKSELQ